MLFADDKNLQSKISYSSTALDENFDRSQRIKKAMKMVQESDQLTRDEKAVALRKLRRGDVVKAVMAGAEESKVKGVGPKLRKKGIGFLPTSNLGKGLAVVSLVFIALDKDPAQAAMSELTWGGAPFDRDENDKIRTNLVLQGVADEMNRRNFIGPPAPKRIGATGGW